MNIEPYKYYRFYLNHDVQRDKSELSQKLLAITGFSIDDYIAPVETLAGEIISLFSDESRTKNQYAVSVVVTRHQKMNDFILIENQLESLVKGYGLNHIHFRDFFGRTQTTSLSRQNKKSFMQEYTGIVRGITLACNAQSHNISHLKAVFGEAPEHELYFQLFLNVVQYTIAPFPEHSIFHLYREQPINMFPVPSREGQKKLIHEYWTGIREIIKRENKYFSFCNHPHFFSKRALLISSLTDLAAYTSSVVQNQIERGVPPNKILRDKSKLLSLFKTVFPNYSGFTSFELIDLLNQVDAIV